MPDKIVLSSHDELGAEEACIIPLLPLALAGVSHVDDIEMIFRCGVDEALEPAGLLRRAPAHKRKSLPPIINVKSARQTDIGN